MTSTTTKPDVVQPEAETAAYLFDDWFDPIEAGLRNRVRDFIETMIRSELDAALARPRYARRPEASDGGATAGVAGHRHGSRTRTLTGTFGKTEIAVPRARRYPQRRAHATTRKSLASRSGLPMSLAKTIASSPPLPSVS